MSAPAAAAPLVSRVRKLPLRDKVAYIIATTWCAFIGYHSLMANLRVSQSIVDSRVCVPIGARSPDGKLMFAAIFAGCSVMCSVIASYKASQILFSANVTELTRSHLGRLVQLLFIGVFFSSMAYTRTTAAFDRQKLMEIVKGIVSTGSSDEEVAVRCTGWMVISNIVAMAAVMRMMYSREDKPGTAFAQAGHAMTQKLQDRLLGKKTPEQKKREAAERVARKSGIAARIAEN